MTPTHAAHLRTTSGAPLDLAAFAAAGGTLTLDGHDVSAAPLAMAGDGGAHRDTFEGRTIEDLLQLALGGRLGGPFRGPGSYRQAVERIMDCDPLDVGLRMRARAASQVPVRLSRVKGGTQRDRERLRASIVGAAHGAGALSTGAALRLPPEAGADDRSVPMAARNAFGRRDPHGAVALAVRMHQMEGHGELEEVTDHPLLDMLGRPNPLTTTTWAQLLDAVVFQRVAWGETFVRPSVRAARAGLAPPEAYLVEDPSTVTVVLNERRNRLVGYDLGKANAKRDRTVGAGGAPDVRAGELVHVKDLDPLCHLRGRTHLRSLWVWTEIYLMAARWNGGLIKNGAKPSGILSRRDGRALGGRQRERAQETADRRTGPENAGKAWVDGELVWNRVGFSPHEMDWEGAEMMSFRRCSTGVGVDPILQGVGEFSTYNNQNTAMGRLYTEAALPDLVWLLSGFNEGVVPLVAADGEELVLWADPTEIPALRTDAKELAETLAKSTWLSDGERREAQGYDYDADPRETPATS